MSTHNRSLDSKAETTWVTCDNIAFNCAFRSLITGPIDFQSNRYESGVGRYHPREYVCVRVRFSFSLVSGKFILSAVTHGALGADLHMCVWANRRDCETVQPTVDGARVS